MASNDLVPNCVQPCFAVRGTSLESVWHSRSDFGECFPQSPDTDTYPCLNPVYNGQTLNICSDLVHASLAGISIKHYNGKCYQEEDQDEELSHIFDDVEEGQPYGQFLFDSEERITTVTSKEVINKSSSKMTTEESGADDMPERPLCTLQKINFRNSFWNIHQPEMCKLTWGQQYVSSVTVTVHLHEHLLSHGPICTGIHEEQDRAFLLNKELDEYVRLKVLASPRELPPDEKIFNFKEDLFPKMAENTRCKTLVKMAIKASINPKDRFLTFKDDGDVEGKLNIHRSREEFCLTIGKHIRKPPVTTISLTEQETPCEAEEEEVSFHYNWYLFDGEESYGEPSYDTTSELDDEPRYIDPCPQLGLDDLCRAAGKADFSDLRCNPDDF